MAQAGGASTTIFAAVPYRPDEEGQLRATLGFRCPFATPDDDRRCRICVHHRRVRKTGPRYRLDVVICATHPDRYFTLYPPGHFPYGRTAVARCSGEGQLLLDADTREAVWNDTVMEAAQEAKTGDRWPPHSPVKGTRRTQGRHLDFAGLLLGIHPVIGDDERERIATRLGVPTMTLRSAAKQWAVSWSLRGAAVASVIAALVVDASLLDRLLSAGYAAGLWPQPRRWEPPRRWIIARSTEPERSVSPPSCGRDPPPTNSRGAASYGPDPPSSA